VKKPPEHSPKLIARSWRHVLHSQLARAEGLIEGAATTPTEDRVAHATQAILRASVCALSDNFANALHHLRTPESFAHLPRSQAILFRTLIKFASWKTGSLNTIKHLPGDLHEGSGKRERALHGLSKTVDAAIALQRLKFASASRLANDALALSTKANNEGLCGGLLPAVVLAQIHYEHGQLRQAESSIASRLLLAHTNLCPEAAIRAFTLLARISAHKRHYDVALGLLDRCEAMAQRRGWLRVEAECLLARCDILRCVDDHRNATACVHRLERLNEKANPHSAAIQRAVLLARSTLPIHFSTGRLAHELHRAQIQAIAEDDKYAAARLSVALIEVFAATDDDQKALLELLKVLDVGVKAGLHQLFIDAGSAFERLLVALSTDKSSLLHRRRGLQSYVGTLLSARRASHQPAAPDMSGAALQHLSGRERGVLMLIRRGYSNKEVAEALQITPETVKSHAKRLFEKLDARTRAQAVSKAEHLGLI